VENLFITVLISKKRLKLIIGLALVLAILLLTPLLDLPGRLATVVSQGERLVPIYYVDMNEKKVAFSFDASWGAERTEKILQILKENEIKTTFFLTGFWVEAYPEYVKLIVEEGHEIGNHTLTHPHLNSLTKDEVKAELKKIEEMIESISGQKTTLFRPPFGEYSNQVIEAATELGYKTIQWSIDSLDWQNLSQEEIVERVTSRAHKGAIILFHNNGLHTADALPEIIDFYRSHGYEILPISELIYHEDYYIDPNSGAQIKKPSVKSAPDQ
jgi:polysaccharide deacetylase family sporulation protein PdaB